MYKESFAKTFGKIDPEQDWNLASRAGVTVTTASPTDVKVYALTDGKYKLVADYANVSGTKTLGFDVREDVCELMVTDGCMAVKAKIGDSVTFGSATRGGAYGTNGDIKVTEITDENEWFVFDLAESKKYEDKLPEKVNNLGKVTQNFTFISNGAFIVYPTYWDTGDTDEVGIYYTDQNGTYHEISIYSNKSGDELQYETLKTKHWVYDQTSLEIGDECPIHTGCKIIHFNNKDKDGAGSYWVYCDHESKWENIEDEEIANDKFTKEHLDTRYDEIVMRYRSKGVKVEIPAGTLFGMYIKPSFYYTQYSQQEKNKSTFNTPNKDVVAATFTLPNSQNPEEEDMYLCFEDWYASDGDADLNDIVFRFKGAAPSVIDDDPDTWVICSEDLGNTFDLDYNDVVLEVSHVSGKETAKISAIAAGGTLASYIYFNEQCLGEVHELLGQANNVSGEYSPVNVDGKVNTAIIKDQYVTVPADWSLASSAVGNAYNATTAQAMGGISIRVVPKDTQASESEAKNSGHKIQNSTSGDEDNVPYMICVPRNYTREWNDGENRHQVNAWFRWSNECKSLYAIADFGTGTYSTPGHSFAEWVENKDNANDWYKYPTDLTNTTGLFYVESMVDANPPHVDPEDEPVTPPFTYGAQLTESDNGLSITNSQYDIYATFSTAKLPTEGNVIFTVEINKGSGYINAQNKGIHKSSDGSSYTKIETSTFKAGNADGIVQYTITASEYASCSHLKIVTDAGEGATITKVSYKIAQ